MRHRSPLSYNIAVIVELFSDLLLLMLSCDENCIISTVVADD